MSSGISLQTETDPALTTDCREIADHVQARSKLSAMAHAQAATIGAGLNAVHFAHLRYPVLTMLFGRGWRKSFCRREWDSREDFRVQAGLSNSLPHPVGGGKGR
eukprot:2786976-Rhodomonas_salina.1